jgi:hypothetical protein
VYANGDAEVFFHNLDEDSNFKVLYADETIEDGDFKTQLVIYTRRTNE